MYFKCCYIRNMNFIFQISCEDFICSHKVNQTSSHFRIFLHKPMLFSDDILAEVWNGVFTPIRIWVILIRESVRSPPNLKRIRQKSRNFNGRDGKLSIVKNFLDLPQIKSDGGSRGWNLRRNHHLKWAPHTAKIYSSWLFDILTAVFCKWIF